MTFEEAAEHVGEQLLVKMVSGPNLCGRLTGVLPGKPTGTARERQAALVLRTQTMIAYARHDDVCEVKTVLS